MAFVAWVMRTMLSWYCAHYLSVNTQKIHKETVTLQTTFSIHLITMRKTFLSLLILMTSVCVQADLYEDFNTLTTGSWSAATEVSLPSGIRVQ